MTSRACWDEKSDASPSPTDPTADARRGRGERGVRIEVGGADDVETVVPVGRAICEVRVTPLRCAQCDGRPSVLGEALPELSQTFASPLVDRLRVDDENLTHRAA